MSRNRTFVAPLRSAEERLHLDLPRTIACTEPQELNFGRGNEGLRLWCREGRTALASDVIRVLNLF